MSWREWFLVPTSYLRRALTSSNTVTESSPSSIDLGLLAIFSWWLQFVALSLGMGTSALTESSPSSIDLRLLAIFSWWLQIVALALGMGRSTVSVGAWSLGVWVAGVWWLQIVLLALGMWVALLLGLEAGGLICRGEWDVGERGVVTLPYYNCIVIIWEGVPKRYPRARPILGVERVETVGFTNKHQKSARLLVRGDSWIHQQAIKKVRASCERGQLDSPTSPQGCPPLIF